MSNFNNFTFKNVNVIFGVLELQGFGEGDDVIVIETDADQFTKIVGAKGDVTRVQSSDESVTVTIKLLQTSNSNAALNTLYLADKETGAGALPMIITDLESGEVYSIPNAWVMKQPTITRGQGVNTTDWIFQGDRLIPVIA